MKRVQIAAVIVVGASAITWELISAGLIVGVSKTTVYYCALGVTLVMIGAGFFRRS